MEDGQWAEEDLPSENTEEINKTKEVSLEMKGRLLRGICPSRALHVTHQGQILEDFFEEGTSRGSVKGMLFPVTPQFTDRREAREYSHIAGDNCRLCAAARR